MARLKFKKGKKNVNYKHGKKNHPIYTVWVSMRQRCNDKNCKSYPHYGGRGISYDSKWESFQKFYEDMSPLYEKGLTLERIDVNGNYSKQNCCFADRKTQARNRTNTKLVEFNGKSLTLTEWAEILGVKKSTLAQRYYTYKWPVSRVLSI